MRIILMAQCENPKCELYKALEYPDTWLDVGELKKVKDVSPPYGWLSASVDVIGSGPHVGVVACSVECLGPAVEHAVQEAAK